MDVPAGVTQEEGNPGFSIHLISAVLALIFLARRIQPFLSLVDRGNVYLRSKTALTLISMQGHQNHNIFYLRVPDYSVVIWSYMVLEKLKLNFMYISSR